MKICQINCVYGVGSTGKIVRDIHLTLKKDGYDSIVVTPKGSPFTKEEDVFVTSNKLLSYASAILRRGLCMSFDWAYFQTYRIIRILKNERPDVVHLHCINGNDINIYMLLRFLAKNRIKTLYTLHAEFPYTGGCGNTLDCNRWLNGCGKCPNLKAGLQSYFFDGTHRTWKKQEACYNMFESHDLRFTAVSPWLLERAASSTMLKPFGKCVVMNGVDTNIFYYCDTKDVWRNRLGIQPDELIIAHVTAGFFPHEDNLKGGRFIIELAKRLSDKRVKIIVAANYGDGSNLPDNVVYIGRTCSQKELADLYRDSNLTVITSSSETFGMPVAESLCCGTPVVGFKAGGPESITIPAYSSFVTYGNVDALEDTVLSFINRVDDKRSISSEALSVFSKRRMAEDYIKQYKKLQECI